MPPPPFPYGENLKGCGHEKAGSMDDLHSPDTARADGTTAETEERSVGGRVDLSPDDRRCEAPSTDLNLRQPRVGVGQVPGVDLGRLDPSSPGRDHDVEPGLVDRQAVGIPRRDAERTKQLHLYPPLPTNASHRPQQCR